jgi:hypothetical protein
VFGGGEAAVEHREVEGGNRGDHRDHAADVGGDQLLFPLVGAVEQGVARGAGIDDALVVAAAIDRHAVAAGIVVAFAAGAAVTHPAVITFDEEAPAVGGGDQALPCLFRAQTARLSLLHR